MFGGWPVYSVRTASCAGAPCIGVATGLKPSGTWFCPSTRSSASGARYSPASGNTTSAVLFTPSLRLTRGHLVFRGKSPAERISPGPLLRAFC